MCCVSCRRTLGEDQKEGGSGLMGASQDKRLPIDRRQAAKKNNYLEGLPSLGSSLKDISQTF